MNTCRVGKTLLYQIWQDYSAQGSAIPNRPYTVILIITLALQKLLRNKCNLLEYFCGTNLNLECLIHEIFTRRQQIFFSWQYYVATVAVFCNWQYYNYRNTSFNDRKNEKQKQQNIKTFSDCCLCSLQV